MCDCSEEKDRRARERARKEAAEARRLAERAEISDSDFDSGEPPPPRFSPAQIALGTVGFLFALMALLFQTENETLYAILCKLGLGQYCPKPKKVCVDPAKQKWPPPPPPPPPPPKPPCCKPKSC